MEALSTRSSALAVILLSTSCAPVKHKPEIPKPCASVVPVPSLALSAPAPTSGPQPAVLEAETLGGAPWTLAPDKWEATRPLRCMVRVVFSERESSGEVLIEGSAQCMETFLAQAGRGRLHVPFRDGFVVVPISNPLFAPTQKAYQHLWPLHEDPGTAPLLVRFSDSLLASGASSWLGWHLKEERHDAASAAQLCTTGEFPDRSTSPQAFLTDPAQCQGILDGRSDAFPIVPGGVSQDVLKELARVSGASPEPAGESLQADANTVSRFHAAWGSWQGKLRRYWNAKFLRDTVLDYEEFCSESSDCKSEKLEILAAIQEAYPAEVAQLAAALREKEFAPEQREEAKSRLEALKSALVADVPELLKLVTEAQALRQKHQLLLLPSGAAITLFGTPVGFLSSEAEAHITSPLELPPPASRINPPPAPTCEAEGTPASGEKSGL